MPRRSRYIYGFSNSAVLAVALFAIYFTQFDGLHLGDYRFILIGISIAICILGGAFFLFLTWQKIQAQRAWKMADIDNLSGFAFETYLADLLKSRGFTKVEVTGKQGDFGADLLATRNGQRFAIQAKRYNGLVGVDASYQCLGGQHYYHCQRSMVITNSYFTNAAVKHAQSSNIILINRDKLQEWVSDRQKNIRKTT